MIQTQTRLQLLVNVGVGPRGVSVNPAGTKVYVVNYGSNNVSIIDTGTNKITATINVGQKPSGVVQGKFSCISRSRCIFCNSVPCYEHWSSYFLCTHTATSNPICKNFGESTLREVQEEEEGPGDSHIEVCAELAGCVVNSCFNGSRSAVATA